MNKVYLNKISTAVPDYDIHQKFVEFAPLLLKEKRQRDLFDRMANRADIEHRYSFFQPNDDPARLDAQGFYDAGNFPSTKTRMEFYEDHAFILARRALDNLDLENITHLIFTSCTGFYAPGIDLQIVRYYELNPSIERTAIGFMGCHAAVNALKLARHIVRSENTARVLIVNLELCTLHLQNVSSLEQTLSFLLFADGCAASIVSAEPEGLALNSFHSTLISDTPEYITWHIGDSGFDMALKGEVPYEIAASIPENMKELLNGKRPEEIKYWAIHPGGRSILDAVEKGFKLDTQALNFSRDILRRYGNMSSASLMFVLKSFMDTDPPPGIGCGMAFGPGLTVESMVFEQEKRHA
ncbi:MAG: type III polyketide synthase [Alphaproteobacteria bacterium]|nr:type III polyketide synthase [Alphaproteobacteria bacterium]